LKTLIKLLKLGGVGIAVVGSTAAIADSSAIVDGSVRAIATLMVVGGLLLIIGFGLGSVFSESALEERVSVSARELTPTDLKLMKLARELRRPLFQRHVILLIIGLTITPFITAGWLTTPWPLICLVFPAILLMTIGLATLWKKYAVIKKAFISRLSSADREAFLEILLNERSQDDGEV